jgi:hypothetical protein
LPEEQDDRLLSLLKPLGELATTADVISQVPHSYSDLQKFSRKMIEYCWGELREGDILVDVLSKRPDLIALATMYPLFSRRGMKNRALEDAFDWLLSLRSVRALELSPYRKLEMSITLRDLGRHSFWDEQAAYDETWVASLPEPWIIGDGPAYSMTHTVFYATRFGTEPLSIKGDIKEYLTTWTPAWAWYYFSIENYDLFCEMLMVLRCLREPDSENWAGRLQSIQTADGCIRGPYPVSQGLDRAAKEPQRLDFLDHYHTTLVGIMACAMALTFGC